MFNMSSLSSALFEDVWREHVHVNTRNLVLARLSPYLVAVFVLLYLIALPVAKAIGSRARRNWSPVLIPYFGLFFGCYTVGELIALLMTNWGGSVFQCGPIPSEFNQLVITYLQFMFCAFQFIHAFDTIFLLLAGHSQLVTRAHVLERILLISRSYIDLKFYPIGVGCASAIFNSFIYAINYSYLIRHFASSELRPSPNWSGRLSLLRVLLYTLLTGHSVYALSLTSCESPQLVRLSQLITNVILLLAFACDWCCPSDSKSIATDKQKKRR